MLLLLLLLLLSKVPLRSSIHQHASYIDFRIADQYSARCSSSSRSSSSSSVRALAVMALAAAAAAAEGAAEGACSEYRDKAAEKLPASADYNATPPALTTNRYYTSNWISPPHSPSSTSSSSSSSPSLCSKLLLLRLPLFVQEHGVRSSLRSAQLVKG